MKLSIAAVLITCLANGAAALCNGPSFLDQISPTEAAQMDAAVAATPFANGLLWQATRDDTTLTIVGTIHLDTPSLPAIRAVIAPIVQAADLLLVEATPAGETKLLAMLTQTPELYLISEGPTLPDLLTPALWARVKEAAAARNIPTFMIAQFQPWYLGLSLYVPPYATASLAAENRGLDHMIMQDAETANVPINPLEPFNTLVDALREDTMEKQVAALSASLPSGELQDSLFVAMLDSYATAQTAQMWEMSRVALDYIDVDPQIAARLFAETEVKLITDRNTAWVPLIETAALTNANIVVAAGAAHLPGETGLLKLFANSGWAIIPLDQP